METKTYRSDSTWFLHHLDLILRNDFSCRSKSTEKTILAVIDPQYAVVFRYLVELVRVWCAAHNQQTQPSQPALSNKKCQAGWNEA
jgi:hypothetical protein